MNVKKITVIIVASLLFCLAIAVAIIIFISKKKTNRKAKQNPNKNRHDSSNHYPDNSIPTTPTPPLPIEPDNNDRITLNEISEKIDYRIGGRSGIYTDTENIRQCLEAHNIGGFVQFAYSFFAKMNELRNLIEEYEKISKKYNNEPAQKTLTALKAKYDNYSKLYSLLKEHGFPDKTLLGDSEFIEIKKSLASVQCDTKGET